MAPQPFELAPAIIQYPFPLDLAKQILDEARSLDTWQRSELVDDETIQPIRTSTNIYLDELPDGLDQETMRRVAHG